MQALRIVAPVGVGPCSPSLGNTPKLTYATECNPTTVSDRIQCEWTSRAGSGGFRRLPT